MTGNSIGGMGAKRRNFHKELMSRMGYEAEAVQIQDLFLAGKKEQAFQAVPSSFADEISLVGPIDRIKHRLQAWRDSPVTSLLINNRNLAQMRSIAELVLS